MKYSSKAKTTKSVVRAALKNGKPTIKIGGVKVSSKES